MCSAVAIRDKLPREPRALVPKMGIQPELGQLRSQHSPSCHQHMCIHLETDPERLVGVSSQQKFDDARRGPQQPTTLQRRLSLATMTAFLFSKKPSRASSSRRLHCSTTRMLCTTTALFQHPVPNRTISLLRLQGLVLNRLLPLLDRPLSRG